MKKFFKRLNPSSEDFIFKKVLAFFRTDSDDFILTKIKNISPTAKLAFVATIIIGVLGHSYFFLGKTVNEDSIGAMHESMQYLYSSGRWLLYGLQHVRSFYSIPSLLGIVSVFYLAVGNMQLIAALKVKSRVFTVIITLLTTTFPALAYSFGYDFMADAYACAYMLSISAVYLTTKYKHGYLLGAVTLMLSLALYQSYIGMTIGLCMVILVKQLLEKEDIKKALINAGKYVLCGGLGTAAYLGSVKLSLILNQGQLTGYKGSDKIGQIPLAQLPELFVASFKNFVSFFLRSGPFYEVSDFLHWVYAAAILLFVYFLVRLIITKKVYKEIGRLIALFCLLALMPVGLNITKIIAPQAEVSTINIHQFSLAFILILVLCELCPPKLKAITLSKWAAILVTVLIGCNYFVTTQIYYLKINTFYEVTHGFYNRLLMRIEDTEGYHKELRYCVVGNFPSSGYVDAAGRWAPSSGRFPEIKGDLGLRGQVVGLNNSNDIMSTLKSYDFMRDYLGVTVGVPADMPTIERIKQTDAFINMPIWPDKDSVAVIDGVLTVKVCYLVYATITPMDDGKHLVQSVVHNLPEDYRYAWFIYKDGEHVDSKWYTQGQTSFGYEFTEPGEYYVTMLVQNGQQEYQFSGNSPKIQIAP